MIPVGAVLATARALPVRLIVELVVLGLLLAALGIAKLRIDHLDRAVVAADAKAFEAAAREQTATAAAKACGDGVDALREQIQQTTDRAREAAEAARKAVTVAQANAQRWLTAPPAVPGDLCASAQVEGSAWLERRHQ